MDSAELVTVDNYEYGGIWTHSRELLAHNLRAFAVECPEENASKHSAPKPTAARGKGGKPDLARSNRRGAGCHQGRQMSQSGGRREFR
jgi:hypothetical protein